MTDPANATHGLRYNAGKPRIDLVSPSLILAVAAVAAFGASKYAERNWEKGMAFGKVYASLMRHMLAWFSGEDLDAESGKPHTWHIGWNAMALIEYERRVGEGSLPASLDDRPGRHHNCPPAVTIDAALVAAFRCMSIGFY